MKTIGERAQEFRLSKKWNTTRMAKEVGTSRQSIENLEATGSRSPRYIVDLARVMGLTVDELMSPTPYEKLGEIFPPNSQNFKPNQSLAPVDSARPATNLIACLTYLTGYLQGLDPSDRKAAMVQIASLVDEPQRCAKVVASIEAMAGTGFAQAGQKAA
jgi:transcriptional regulator with XRE-family HTH domain